jgi:hypothetical protein
MHRDLPSQNYPGSNLRTIPATANPASTQKHTKPPFKPFHVTPQPSSSSYTPIYAALYLHPSLDQGISSPSQTILLVTHGYTRFPTKRLPPFRKRLISGSGMPKTKRIQR